jgi:hypothetical protein
MSFTPLIAIGVTAASITQPASTSDALLLSGDMNAGSDDLLLSGDINTTGNDDLLLSETP